MGVGSSIFSFIVYISSASWNVLCFFHVLFPTADVIANIERYYEIYSIFFSLCMVVWPVNSSVQVQQFLILTCNTFLFIAYSAHIIQFVWWNSKYWQFDFVLTSSFCLMFKVKCLDSFTSQQTRLVIIVDGLDSCEQDKVLLVLDAVHMLFSSTTSPFIVILAIDPHVISKVSWIY